MSWDNMAFLRSMICAALLHAPLSYAHMAMTDPQPWDSPKATNAAVRDYDIKSPLKSDGSNFPCQGVRDAAMAPISANYTAGETYNMMIEGSANHGGGSCQLALSYDSGETFKVIKSVVGGCPARGEATYNFTIPKKAPSGKALFAWTWINHSGNREFYMNCAAVRIRGDEDGSLCGLPNLYVAGISSVNDCRSTEGVDVVYPNPGDDVEYDGTASSSSPSANGNCELPDPVCPADSGSSSSNSNSDDSSDNNTDKVSKKASTTTAKKTAKITTLTTTLKKQRPTQLGGGFAEVSASIASSSCSTRQVVTSLFTAPLPAATCSKPVVACNCAPGDACGPINACTTVCSASRSLYTSTSSTGSGSGGGSGGGVTTTTTTSKSTSATNATSATATGGSGGNNGGNNGGSNGGNNNGGNNGGTTSPRPPYLPTPPQDPPCTPGAFLCASPSSFFTCAPATDNPTGWSWQASRPVAEGMMCLPFDSGKGRDDRHVRARPFGDCEKDGELKCNGEDRFLVCDHGGWVDMGRVAEGTRCRDGGIVGD